jgi:hypothetical protein
MTKNILAPLLLLCAMIARAPAQSRLPVLNKAENSLAVPDGRDYRVVARIPVGEGPREITPSADGKLAFVGDGALRRPHGPVEIREVGRLRKRRLPAVRGKW